MAARRNWWICLAHGLSRSEFNGELDHCSDAAAPHNAAGETHGIYYTRGSAIQAWFSCTGDEALGSRCVSGIDQNKECCHSVDAPVAEIHRPIPDEGSLDLASVGQFGPNVNWRELRRAHFPEE